jgi:hypothetical protein
MESRSEGMPENAPPISYSHHQSIEFAEYGALQKELQFFAILAS